MGGYRIIFMGPDCGGKTALAKELASRFGLEVEANRKKDPGELVDLIKADVDKLLNTKGEFIRDQWPYPVDIVYERTALKNSSKLSAYTTYLRQAYANAGVIFVYVSALPSVLMERYEKRGDELWSLPQILDVANDYALSFLNSEFAEFCIRIDTSSATTEEAADTLVAAIEVVQNKINRMRRVLY